MIRKVKDGDPLRIPASAYNAFVDAAEAHRGGRHDARVARPSPSSPQTGIVRIKNASGADAGRFGVLGIDGPLFDPATNEDGFKNAVVLTGVTPTADHVDRFAICLRPIKAGMIGQAVVAGVCVVKVDVQAESDTHTGAAAGYTAHLTSGESGAAAILWKEAGTGEKWAVIRFGGSAGAGMEEGSEDGEIWVWKYDPSANPPVAEWIRLPPPSVYSILVFDPTAAAGEKVQWVAPAECTGA